MGCLAWLVGWAVTVGACVGLVDVTHGWALVVPGVLAAGWAASALGRRAASGSEEVQAPAGGKVIPFRDRKVTDR